MIQCWNKIQNLLELAATRTRHPGKVQTNYSLLPGALDKASLRASVMSRGKPGFDSKSLIFGNALATSSMEKFFFETSNSTPSDRCQRTCAIQPATRIRLEIIDLRECFGHIL